MAVTYVDESGFVWIRQAMPYNWKFTLDGVDITSDVLEGEVTMVCTNAVGNYKLKLNNNHGAYDNLAGNESFIFYADLANASTKRFSGVVEKMDKELGDMGHTVNLEGSHNAVRMLDITVTQSYEQSPVSEVVKNIIGLYLSDFTDNNVVDVEMAVTVNWANKPFLDCMNDLCRLADCDFYVDDDKDFHFFDSGGILSTTQAVTGTKDGNLRSITGLGEDVTLVKNKVIVYGQGGDGLTIVATAEDSTSQTSYEIKELVVKDTSINTYDEALARAEGELSLLKDTKTAGTVESDWLLTLNPGEKMWISIPERGIHDKYIIKKHTMKFPDLASVCSVYTGRTELADIFKKRIEKEQANQVIDNPFEMNHSYNFSFDDNTNITHVNTKTLDGSLVLSSGTTGTCTSSPRESTTYITQCVLKVTGQDLGSSTFKVSNNNGKTYETITTDSLYSFAGSGKKLLWKVTLLSDSSNTYPMIDSLAILYK